MAKNIKKRNWAFFVYPESAPENWRDILQETGLQCCISPLHDKDIDPDGNVKKAHYHVIVCFSGPTTYNVVLKLTESLNQPIPQPLEQVKGYYRYLTHKDNPEKYQYDEKDIVCINGFSILDYAELTRSEITKIKISLHKLIIDKDFVEYTQLMDYLLVNEMFSEYDVASNNTIFFNQYLRSRRHFVPEEKTVDIPSDEELQKNNLIVSDGLAVDPDTGEVIENN